MSLSFLLFALANLWLAWNLFRPIYRPVWAMIISGMPGIFISELAIHFVLAEMLITLAVFFFCDISGYANLVSLALLVLAWAAMCRHYYRSAEVATVMEEAMQRELGDDYYSAIPRRLADKLGRALPIDRLFRPFHFRFDEVTRIADIVFYRGDDYSLELDVYHRSDKPENAPVLLYIHGGGWMTGHKAMQALPLINYLAARGWVVVSVNYRLSPKYAYPAHLVDCKRGLAWIKKHIAEYGGDPGFVAVSGGSTGGNLSALMALTQNQPQFQPGFEQESTEVNCCVDMYGVHDFSKELGLSHVPLVETAGHKIMHTTLEENPELFKMASPVAQINTNAPLFMVVHGERDNITSCPEAERFCELLGEVSEQPVVFAKIPLAHHGFDMFWSLRALLANLAIERFMTFAYSRYLSGQTEEDTSE